MNCQNVKLREFRYDSGRRRYLLRERAVTSPYAPISSQWTDYDGDAPWLDYTLSGAAATAVNEYVAGLAQRVVGESEMVYFHGDQIGSTRMLTDDAGLPARRVVYTAFGEPIYSEPPAQAGGPTRYLYAGAWGYENLNDAAFPYLHVGERWYDPATGRFLQRDPIGIDGGVNVYAYVSANPAKLTDPMGTAYINPLRPPGTPESYMGPYRAPKVCQPGSSGPPGPAPLHRANDALRKVYCLHGVPSMIEGAIIADIITTIFLVPMEWIGVETGYRPGDISRDVTKSIGKTLQ